MLPPIVCVTDHLFIFSSIVGNVIGRLHVMMQSPAAYMHARSFPSASFQIENRLSTHLSQNCVCVSPPEGHAAVQCGVLGGPQGERGSPPAAAQQRTSGCRLQGQSTSSNHAKTERRGHICRLWCNGLSHMVPLAMKCLPANRGAHIDKRSFTPKDHLE